MNSIVVGVADCQVTNDREATLVTYALGSCLAIAIYDPVACVGGMLHFMLPESALDPAKAERNPYMFADSGIPFLFRNAYAQGAEKKRLWVRIAGGANVMDESGVFNIGKRNHLAVRKILWKAGVLVHGESVGGGNSRTVRLEMATGKLWLQISSGARQEMPVGMPAPKGVEQWRSGS